MKQWQFTKSGLPRDILEMIEVPIPVTCGDDQVLIKVSHVGFNTAFASKIMPHYAFLDPIKSYKGIPAVPEMDFSGIVCDLKGKNAKYLNTGDKVFGATPPWFFNFGNGVLREYILVSHEYLTKIPDNTSFKDASATIATGITVYYAMIERFKLKEGDRVFLTGAAGAVGVLAVQLARKLVGPSGYVVASCRTSKIEAVKELGAHEVIDYTKHHLPTYLNLNFGAKPFDVIYDIVGNDHALFAQSPQYLAPSGTFYTIGIELGNSFFSKVKRMGQFASAMAWPVVLGGVPRTHIFASTKMKPGRIQGLAKLLSEGAVKAVVDSVFHFDDVLLAYDRVMSREVIGRVVVEVADVGQ